MRKLLLLTSFIMANALIANGQILDIKSLFRPGVRVTMDWIPEQQWGDSSGFGVSHYRISTVIPLKTKVGVDLSKLKLNDLKLKDVNVQASQRFLTINAGYRDVQISRVGENRKIWNATIGLTGIKATTKSGFWLWTANLGFVESMETSSPNPFFVGGIVHARIKGVHKQNFLGLALTASRTSVIPLPIIGWRRKLMPKTHINIFLPVHLSIDRNLGKGTSIMWTNNFSAFTSFLAPDQGRETFDGKQYSEVGLGYSGLRSGFAFKTKVAKGFKFMLAGGVTVFDRVYLFDTPRKSLESHNRNFHPYATATLFYKLGKKGGLGSEIFGNEI